MIRSAVLRLALVLAGLALAFAAPLAGQTTAERLLERRLEFRAAATAYEAAQSALSVVEAQFAAALNQRDQARRANDEIALERAYREALSRSVPVASQRQHVAEAGEEFRAARQALIEVLIVRQQELFAEFDAAGSRAERNSIDAILRDVSLELEQLEAEAEEALTLGPIAMPSIQFDEREGPEQLLFKAEILERSAARTDTLLVTLETQITGLRGRLDRERTRSDFLGGVDRFGDRVDLTSSAPPGADRAAPGDSLVAGGLPISLEERIAALEAVRDDLVEWRDELILRARLFRERIRRRTYDRPEGVA